MKVFKKKCELPTYRRQSYRFTDKRIHRGATASKIYQMGKEEQTKVEELNKIRRKDMLF